MTNATEQIKNPNEDYNALKKTYFQLSMFAILLNFAQRNNLSEFCRVEAEAQVYESLGEASELILKARSRALLSKVNEILPSDGMPIAKERSKLMHPPKNYLKAEHFILLSLLTFVVEENLVPKCYKNIKETADLMDRSSLKNNANTIFNLSINPFIMKSEDNLNSH